MGSLPNPNRLEDEDSIHGNEAQLRRQLTNALPRDNNVGVCPDRDPHLVITLRGALQQGLTQSGAQLALEQVAAGVDLSLRRFARWVEAG